MDAPTIKIPLDSVKNTPTILANILAVVALRITVPSTIINTNGVIYSAPGTPSSASLSPNNEAIPAATIPRGPTQLINSFSLSFKLEPWVLKNTPIGLITNTTTENKITVFQL